MNLLVDPLIRVETSEGMTEMSLPALLESLGQDRVERLPGLQLHQEDPFHVFLTSLATAILSRDYMSDPVQTEGYWLEGLRKLASSAGDDAWTLVVDDLSRPAFMQPPLPAKDHEKLSLTAATPDALDVLQTAKNHDVKAARAIRPHADNWIYALVSLQTMSGFLGRGNYGISKMNSGFGNRSIVELVRSTRPGRRWQDAVVRLLPHRESLLNDVYGYRSDGLVLVWVEPWDGSTSLRLSNLDPVYIEICRRIRLRGRGGTISHAAAVPAQTERIAAKELKGVVGDAWLPVDLGDRDTAEPKALTVSPQGLTPDLLRRIVFEDRLRLSALQKPLGDWNEALTLRVSVLVRGQGTTDGFHVRHIAIPPKVRMRLFGPPERRDPLARLSLEGISYAGRMLSGVLRPAAFTLIQGAPGVIKYDRDSAQAWWRRFATRFESLWSERYFPWLWSVEEPIDQDAALLQWATMLRDDAWLVFREVGNAMPMHAGRKYKTWVHAERAFWGALYSEANFPFLKEVQHEYITAN